MSLSVQLFLVVTSRFQSDDDLGGEDIVESAFLCFFLQHDHICFKLGGLMPIRFYLLLFILLPVPWILFFLFKFLFYS